MNEKSLKECLEDLNFFDEIRYYDEVDSTNDRAKYAAKNNKLHNAIFAADYQYKGRGKLERKWDMPKGKDLMFTLMLKPNIVPNKAPAITMVMAQSIINALKQYKTGFKIKWPNDILYDNKKIAGVLTEMDSCNDKIKYIVIGVGINCNSDIFEGSLLKSASSIKLITGIEVDREKFLRKIIAEFIYLYEDFLENGLLNIVQDIKKNSVILGKRVSVVKAGMKSRAYVKDISKNGNLVVEYDNGKEEALVSGEIII